MLPVGEAGQDHALEVGHQVGEGLGRRGRPVGELGRDGAGRELRADRQALDAGQVVGHPVGEAVRLAAEAVEKSTGGALPQGRDGERA